MIPMGGPEPKGTRIPAIPMMAPGDKATPAPKTPGDIAREVRSRLTHQLRHDAARRYGALLAADRTAEAEAVASAVLSYADDEATRAALIECALRAGQINTRREAHLAWLDAISNGAGR